MRGGSLIHSIAVEVGAFVTDTNFMNRIDFGAHNYVNGFYFCKGLNSGLS
jgi:hypothetical protein